MNSNTLFLKRLGINTQQEYFVYMRTDCHICISEGFEAFTRIQVTVKGQTSIATLNVINSDLLHPGEASLSESAWKTLKATEGDEIKFRHLQPVSSMNHVRAKMYGKRLNKNAFSAIIKDISKTRYSNIELAAFISACSGDNLDVNEITALTEVMVDSGKRLQWRNEIVVDKHCIGGLPGNRTTPIVVSIAAAAGLIIPKTSSRAITSPAGTADTMETMTNVNLSLEQIRDVIEQEGGCLVWGGAVALSPADDVIIKVEKALDIDSEGQMIASVLSKKVAAGSTHVVIDIPVGETAKVRNQEDAQKLKKHFIAVGKTVGLKVKVLITDGSQPVGRGIGPALEATDVLAVLRNEKDAPKDLKDRAILIAGAILELAGKSSIGKGQQDAIQILKSEKAITKFISICNAQGGFNEPTLAKFKHEIKATRDGIVKEIDNRKLAKIAKLAGAPGHKTSGVNFLSPIGSVVNKGKVLFVIHAESKGVLEYALEYYQSQKNILTIE